ncbi:MAG: TIGR04282 family arsenosugar biosynthesis glycosyltransferase [Gemmatimonadetes bacterium]|nr:TIGR04282 family arsenosugar biosynthesis glycosyltransferase [Gemmatimonadota bacterium]
MMPRERVLVFGRLPEPGKTKTRLAPALGDEGAATLYAAFLDDAVAGLAAGTDRELWVPSRPGADRLATRYPSVSLRFQRRGDLGEKLADAFERTFEDAVDYAVIVGSDHPTLPRDHVPRALRALRGAHLALGPTRDGGYYAIGLRRYAWPSAAGLFDGAPWSRPELLEWTRARAVELDLCHVELPAWYDVDRPEDLIVMERDLDPDSATGRVWEKLGPELAVE